MARPREPIDLIAAKGRKHLTKAEYEERKKTEIEAPDDDIKAPSFLLKKEKEKFDILAKQLVDLKIMSNLDCDVLARYVKAETEYIKITKQLQKIHFTPDKKKHSARGRAACRAVLQVQLSFQNSKSSHESLQRKRERTRIDDFKQMQTCDTKRNRG